MKELIRQQEPVDYCMIFHPIELMELEDVILFHLWKEDDIMDALDSVLWLNKISLN